MRKHEFTFSVKTLISGRCRVIYETRDFDTFIYRHVWTYELRVVFIILLIYIFF